jgi:glycerol kinase
LIAVLDVGTTGSRTTVYDESGHPIEFVHREYDNIVTLGGIVEQDPRIWTRAVFETVRDCARRSRLKAVDAIVVTSQRATIMPIGKNGKLLSDAILWLDKRGMKECRFIESKIGKEQIYRRTGLRIDPYFSAPKILWIKRNRPYIYRKARKFFTVHDYILHALAGVEFTDETQASRTMLFNIIKREWDDYILRMLDIDSEKLPQVSPTGAIVGELSREASNRVGIPRGIPVMAGGGDQQLAALGLGLIDGHRAGITTGSGSFTLAHVTEPLMEEKRRVLCSVSAAPNSWLLEAGIYTTGSIYKWWRDISPNDGTLEARQNAFELLDRQALQSLNKHPSNLIVLPHFAGSAAPYWNPLAKGLIFNLTLGTSRADLIAGIMVGICVEAKKNLKIIEDMLGNRFKEVFVAGGASKSRVFTQLQADVLGKPVLKVSTNEATSLGGAMLAMVKLGFAKNLRECSNQMVQVKSKIKPRPHLTSHYDRLLEVNEKLYEALKSKGIYEVANALNGNYN